jgi:hypothetical protein
MSKENYIKNRIEVDTITGCWNWINKLNPKGYGITSKTIAGFNTAHRTSYAIFVEDPSGLCVCHKCDNRKCCNPEHLFLGTQEDNIRDMVAKDRHAKGETSGAATKPECLARGSKAGNSILTEEKVSEFRIRAAAGEYYRDFASELECDPSIISLAVRGKTWKHVETPPVVNVRSNRPRTVLKFCLARHNRDFVDSLASSTGKTISSVIEDALLAIKHTSVPPRLHDISSRAGATCISISSETAILVCHIKETQKVGPTTIINFALDEYNEKHKKKLTK